jgi:hypothetical protein
VYVLYTMLVDYFGLVALHQFFFKITRKNSLADSDAERSQEGRVNIDTNKLFTLNDLIMYM